MTAPAGRLGDRDRDPTVADRELDERAVGLAGEIDVEGDVGRHGCRPLVVTHRERLVPRSHRRSQATRSPDLRRCGGR